MGTLKLKYTQKKGAAPDEYWLSKASFRKFNPRLLSLGDISKDGERFEAIVAILDLKEFTAFCDQTDHNPEVLKYLNGFIHWLFGQISKQAQRRDEGANIVLWSHLPFFAKFLGDGVLFLWDARNLSPDAKSNVVVDLQIICNDYEKSFFPIIRKRFTKPPSKLRCGIAQGQIISIGEYGDFVGHCINLASRLQKLEEGQFSFAFTKKGFDQESWHKDFRLIRVPIRGINKDELVYVLRNEFKMLLKSEQEKLSP